MRLYTHWNQLQQFFFIGFVFWICKLSFLNTGTFVYFLGADFDLFNISEHQSISTWYHQIKCLINVRTLHCTRLKESHTVIFRILLSMFIFILYKKYISLIGNFSNLPCFLLTYKRYLHCHNSLIPSSIFISFRKMLIS